MGIASSATSCRRTRSRCARISATRASRTSGSCAIRATEAEFQRYAKLPLIPLVVTPDGQGMQDSTPIIEHFEALLPGAVDPSGRPGARVSLGADRGVRRRVGQQADVPLPLVLRAGPAVGRRAPRAQHDARTPIQRDGRRDDQGAHDPAPHARRLVAPRPRIRSKARSSASWRILGPHLAAPQVPVRRPPGVRRLRPVRAALPMLDRSDAGALMRGERAARAAHGSSACSTRRSKASSRTGSTLESDAAAAVQGRDRPASSSRGRRPTPQALAAGQKEFSMTLAGKPYSQETQKYSRQVARRAARPLRRRRRQVALDPIPAGRPAACQWLQ